MLHRRRFLALGLAGGTLARLGISSTEVSASPLATAAPGESVFDYILQVRGKWDATLYKQLLGAANEFKEGSETDRCAYALKLTSVLRTDWI